MRSCGGPSASGGCYGSTRAAPFMADDPEAVRIPLVPTDAAPVWPGLSISYNEAKQKNKADNNSGRRSGKTVAAKKK